MPDFLLLATAWGPRHGGINAFNMDFATGLAGYLRASGRVFCAVLDASREDCERANVLGVMLVPIGRDINSPCYDESWAYTAWEQLQQQYPGTSIDWWIGHDVTSAEAALKGPQVAREGHCALIMHMNYADYTSYKHGVGAEAARKERRQRGLFKRAEKHFAVGPLLRNAMRDMVDGHQVTMLVPGFPTIESRPATHELTVITFGRMDRESQRIKQGGLAVAGFATAVRSARQQEMPQALCSNPQMRLIGIEREGGEEEAALQSLADSKAGRKINLLAQPFDEDRDALLDQLRRANIALMLSWHEGFGLTGWEAIATEVPPIVGKQSGLYRLVDETLENPGTACLHPIDVEGQDGDDDTSNFTAADEDAVRKAIMDIAKDLPRAQRSAKRLKEELQNHLVCTWENTARQFCEGLGLKPDQPSSTIAVRPPPDQRGPRSSGAVVEDKSADTPDTGAPPPLIAFPERRWPDSLGIEMPDSLMLLPQQEVVRFHSYRQGLLDEVLKWALTDDERITLRLQAGEGGTGKTRIAMETCRKLNDEHGWRTGFLRTCDDLEAEFRNFLGEGGDCLVVMDYAETRTGEVVTLTRTALKASPKSKLRLLLLARDGGDWWDRLADGAKDDAALAGLLRRPSTKTGPYRMSEEPIEQQARSAVFQEALAWFAREKRQGTPAVATPDLTADHFGQILFIHLAALASLRGSPATGDRELLDMAIGHERDYWRRLLKGSGPGEVWFDALEQAIALLTLFGGADSAREAKVAIRRTPRLGGASPLVRDQLFDLLRRLYRHGGGVSGLQPDLLGEHLVAAALAHDDELIDVALEEASSPEQARNALTLLTRLAKRDPAEERWLRRALERHLGERAKQALEVALETGTPMPEMIAAILRSVERGTQRRLVRTLRPNVPEETVNLRGLAVDLAEYHVMFLVTQKGDRRGWKAAKQFRDAYQDLGARHEAKGRLKEVAEARERALFHAAIMARSGTAADRANLGGAHYNLAHALGRIGSFEGALVHAAMAEKIYRDVAERQPNAYRAGWAGSLGRVSTCLSELGRYKEALAKAEQGELICRELAELQPDAYRINWASALHTLAVRFGELGHYEEALTKNEKAEAICRDLMELQPDAYRESWIASLGNLAISLSELGRYEEALPKAEQVEAIHRELAERQPDAYRADWGNAFTNQANVLRDLGRYEQAFAKAEQAEAIARDLAERQPEAYRRRWGLYLGNLAEIAIRGGLPHRALPAAERGVEVLQSLAVYPNVDRDHLGFCLRVLAEALLETGNAHRALEQAQRGEKIWATIFAERPAYACDQYGKSLPVLARARLAVEGQLSAVETLVGGIEAIAPYFQQRPRALCGVMDGLVRALRDIDPTACAERIPAELIAQLHALSEDAPRRQASNSSGSPE